MCSQSPWVLIADEDVSAFNKLKAYLEPRGYRITSALDSLQLREALSTGLPDLLVLSLQLRDCAGLDLYADLASSGFEAPVVCCAARPSVAKAVRALKMGALDFLEKPVDPADIEAVFRRVATRAHEKTNATKIMDKGVANDGSYETEMLGESAAMRKIRDVVADISRTDASVLIFGENGTGKELVAREIHRHSLRCDQVFLPLNLSAVPDSLIESTLFGYEKGAFTGANRTTKGYCEEADGGTLFLDEIGELSLALQPKLLRFLQDQTVQRVGSTVLHRVNVRILAATNRDVREMVQEGTLREDLYYRLNVVPIFVPPLRARGEDIGLLAEVFRERACRKHHKHLCGFTPAALEVICEYDWPGNIRQLENLVERLVILSRGDEIGVDVLPSELFEGNGRMASSQSTRETARSNGNNGHALRPIHEMEKAAIIAALADSSGHVATAARSLGLGQATLYRKLKRYGISRMQA